VPRRSGRLGACTPTPAPSQAKQLSGAILLVVAAKRARSYDEKVLRVAAGVLLKNPDVYTLWNYRREALAGPLAAGGPELAAAAAVELKLTEQCLLEQPKSYGTWHHRRWVVERAPPDLPAELDLVSKCVSTRSPRPRTTRADRACLRRLLRADSRNFHGWAYRFWLAALMGRADEDELEYTHQLVTADFSNFSAWHYRSRLLPRVHAARGHRSIEELVGGYDGEAARDMGASAPAQAELPPMPLYELASEFELLKTARTEGSGVEGLGSRDGRGHNREWARGER